MRARTILVGVALVVVLAAAAACGDDGGGDTGSGDGTSDDSAATTSSSAAAIGGGVDPALFDTEALVDDVTEVDCTLDDGSASSCWQLTVHGVPTTVSPGPFCPSTVDDPEHGIWYWDGDEPGLYGLDAAFWALLDEQGYDFVGADGSINVADPAEPGDPDVNACLEATPADGTELQVLVPSTPELAAEPTEVSTVARVAIGLDGVTTFGDAPSVAGTGNLPALDPCGGHYDPAGYYHHHFEPLSIGLELEQAGIDLSCSLTQDPTALFGYALDGHALYGPYDEDGEVPEDLDECNGHEAPTAEDPEGVYHYHALLASPNLPPCLVGLTAEDSIVNLSSDQPVPGGSDAGGGQGGQGGPGGPPDGATPRQVVTEPVELGGDAGHCHAVVPGGAPDCH